MTIEKLSGDFIRGYTKSIQDISEVFDYVNNDLKCHKKTTEWQVGKRIAQMYIRKSWKYKRR